MQNAALRMVRRTKTIQWNVTSACNYRCSYCIQSDPQAGNRTPPPRSKLKQFIEFLSHIDGTWDIHMSGGEVFVVDGFTDMLVRGIIKRTPHTISLTTNLSASEDDIVRFIDTCAGRLTSFFASLHLEHTGISPFLSKALVIQQYMRRACPTAEFLVGSVLVPGKINQLLSTGKLFEREGIFFRYQILQDAPAGLKYDRHDLALIASIAAHAIDSPKCSINTSPSYRGRMCWAGVDYFILDRRGRIWRCYSAREAEAGDPPLGSALDGSLALANTPSPCTYMKCACGLPLARGMIDF